MNIKTAEKTNIKLRIGISGASGYGKTLSSLLLANGLTKDWSKIVIIDTENGSSNLYAHLGSYRVLSITAPYTPEKYIRAIKTCENEDVHVIIIDSISHEWKGLGGCLDIHSKIGGRFQDWGKVTPRHQAFINSIIESRCHVISTIRRKIEYVLENDDKGKLKVVKHGTKEETRNGFEYEMTLNFELMDENHFARVTKDRTGIFNQNFKFIINTKTGEKLANWCMPNKADTNQ
ncbi:AAA family ATPase [Costertonia aggregata]|uniref:AAA family ATPase n=1 Tax=Costertonia aggregata TaxID=343403 RepID=A0A7H9APR2_9FLAO|nr:AAA family ATPase [Costertonia aggregata]QLG45407.1 AAA family ATPase [Costertonia aggregata]